MVSECGSVLGGGLLFAEVFGAQAVLLVQHGARGGSLDVHVSSESVFSSVADVSGGVVVVLGVDL